MTKVKIIYEGDHSKKELKPIEFHKECMKDRWIDSNPNGGDFNPKDWLNIELIAREFAFDLDLMFAYDHNRSSGVLYLGKFNDGVV